MKPFTELVHDKDSCEKILKHFAGDNAKFDKASAFGTESVDIFGHSKTRSYMVALWNDGDVFFDVNGSTRKSLNYSLETLPEFFITLGYGPKL